MPRRLAEPRLRIRAALSLHVQLAPRVPRDGRVAPAPHLHRSHDAAGGLIVAAPTAEGTVRWGEGREFEGGGAGRPALLGDGGSRAGTSPVERLLASAAACTASVV